MSIFPKFPLVGGAPKQPLPEASSNKRRPCLKFEEESPHNSDDDSSRDPVASQEKMKKTCAKTTYPIALTHRTSSARIAQCDRTEDRREEVDETKLEKMFMCMHTKV